MVTIIRNFDGSDADQHNILDRIKRSYTIGKHIIKNDVWVVRRTPGETTDMNHN